MISSGRAVVVPALAAVCVFKIVLIFFPLAALTAGPVDGPWVVGAVAITVVILAQPYVTTAVLRGRHRSRGPVVVAAIELFTALPPLFLLDARWVAVPTLGMADLLLCATGRIRVVLALAGAAAFLLGSVMQVSGLLLFEQVGEALLSVTIFYSVLRMATLVRELGDARLELARLAVGQERLRMARDLHDTLGHTLTVGLFKLEVARRMAGGDPERVRRELGEVSDLMRDSMSAVQDVVTGARDTSLHGEITGALSVLRSAGIAATVELDDEPLPAEVEQALGWVVRECTTNVLRHSSATTCSIELARRSGAVVLTMSNDAPAPPGRRWAPSGGQGVAGMRQRLEGVGGVLDVDSDAHRYRMVAQVPEVAS